MNSTNQEYSIQAEQFFYQVLVPLARKLRSENKPIFFRKKADDAKDTYFVGRKTVTMTPEEFERGGCNSSEDLVNTLVGLWIAEGHTELPTLADAIVNLSKSVHQIEEQDSEVSPFMYVMF